ncbi:carcinoembryonic antigen-related cell adhesion molecule 5-like isoform X2 [Parambassis ranga]|uniref:Carcinoembryonic antigen-related cell adhesion molecule 5-like isoform X2 n=1 Tax=Parambassis ranga TaxID=210632 RepID=A0A6P7IJA4_9TELE|nr:carcinoembryonic antigen-related cell adhesion molecule 5-like isoform X2 [Parambassis ranga]
MTQLCGTASTHEASWKMQLFEVFCVFCLTAACAAQDPENDSPIPVLQQMTAWLDVFPSESVKFNCSIEGSSDWTLSWYRDYDEIGSENLSEDGAVLTIPSVSQTHSGNYSCVGEQKGRFSERSEELKLTVYDEKPKPTVSKKPDFNPMYIGETVSLTCTVNVASGWKYQWYRNGQKLAEISESIRIKLQPDHKGNYSCQATRGQITVTSDQTPLDVLAVPAPTLKVQSQWQDVFEGEEVEFMCGVDSHGWTFTWYKNEQSQASEQSLIGSLFKITANKMYEGQYSCKAHLSSRGVTSAYSNTAKVTVYDQIPKPTVSKAPNFNPMYVGELVIITCKVDMASDWTYQWYRNEQMLSDVRNVINISLKTSDKGNYSCKATRGKTTTTEASDKMPLDVVEIPIPSLKNITNWLDVFPTETVRFSCHIQTSSSWIYEWLKDTQKMADETGATLSISSASDKHRGQYECKGHLPDRGVSSHSSPLLTLKVYDTKPAVVVTQNPDYKVMFPGESVNFSCHINVSSGWKYQWSKDGKELTGLVSKDYSIEKLKTTDKGSYTCQTKRGSNPFFGISSPVKELDVKGENPKPLLIQKPGGKSLFAGESVEFECKVEISTGWSYQWYKDGQPFHVNSNNFKRVNATLSDSGTYECKAMRGTTRTKHSDTQPLNISEIPVPSLKLETQWLDVFPTESAKLRCRMPSSSEWTYAWFKDAQKQPDDETVSFDADRTTLTIRSASAAHRGKYSCSAQLKSRPVGSRSSSEVILDVHDTKPTVTLKQDPESRLMHTGDSVSFSCHINVSSGWDYVWYKDGTPFSASGNSHTISSVQTSSSGSYECQVKRGVNPAFRSDYSQAAELEVKERPQAGIILLTGWSEVFSTDSLVLRCEVMESEDEWNYTWYKADSKTPINQSTSDKHIVTPQNDPDQSLYTCKGVRNGRPSYSKTSESFRTKNLLLKRRVLLSISGCIFFGIIAVFIGCFVLRVTRKPAGDDMKPEEENLFLTMAQQKGCDTPCPLVEYITDAALNAPPKEENENGTVCSEATPLPITTQEDQAVPTGDHDAAENGGLVSFK